MSSCTRFMLSGLLALTAAAVAQAATPSSAATGDIFPYKVHESSLDNGLNIVVIPYDSPGTIAYFMIVRTGARDEVDAGHTGFAHFFEHMMFRGTEKYPKDRFDAILKSMGADSNGTTSNDWTIYTIIGPASQLETMMTVDSDRFKNLKYAEEIFRIEAQAVLGEYNKNFANPILPMIEKQRRLAFEKHTYKHLPIGFLEDIQAMPTRYQYSLQFFDRFYRPENITMVVVGDVQPQNVPPLAKKYFGDWKKGYKPAKIETEPPQTEQKKGHIDWPNPTLPMLTLGYHTPAFSTDNVDTAALDLLGELLLDSSGPLYQELVVQKQWANSIQGGMQETRDPYLFTVIAQAKSEDLIPKIKEVFDQHVARLIKEPVDSKQLERMKSHVRYAFALGLDSPGAVANEVTDMIALTGDVGGINRHYANYQKVTPADIQRVARETFRTQNETIVTLSHKAAGKSEETGKAQGGADHE